MPVRRLLVVALVLGAAAPAHAQEFSATASPDPVRWPDDQRITWRVKITTMEPRQLSLWLHVRSRSPDSFGVKGFGIGGLLRREVALEGPGTLSMGPSTHGDPCWAFVRSLPMYGLPYLHGHGSDGQEITLDLPENSESTLIVPSGISRHAPWAGARHELAITPTYAPGERPYAVSQVAVQGPTGLPIAFGSEPASVSPVCVDDAPEHPAGTEIVIRGHTDPRAAGDFMTIMAGAPGETAAQEVGRAPIAADGTFSFRGYRPREAGYHAIAAHYRSQRPELADDFAPPLAFRIGAAQAAPEPPPAGFPALVGRSRARTKAALRLRCAFDTRCSGRVRLRRHGRSLSARRYLIEPNREAVLRLPLPARELRMLRRRGLLAVEVELEIAGGRRHAQRVTLLRR